MQYTWAELIIFISEFHPFMISVDVSVNFGHGTLTPLESPARQQLTRHKAWPANDT